MATTLNQLVVLLNEPKLDYMFEVTSSRDLGTSRRDEMYRSLNDMLDTELIDLLVHL
jgi:hypothetical protein